MSQFSESDINDAKKRVRDMQSRASRYVNEKAQAPAQSENNHTKEHSLNENCEEEKTSDKEENDNSFIIVLIMLMILSREGADNKLLLALLYLLL